MRAGAGVPDAAGDGRGHAAAAVPDATDGAAQLWAAPAGPCLHCPPAHSGMTRPGLNFFFCKIYCTFVLLSMYVFLVFVLTDE